MVVTPRPRRRVLALSVAVLVVLVSTDRHYVSAAASPINGTCTSFSTCQCTAAAVKAEAEAVDTCRRKTSGESCSGQHRRRLDEKSKHAASLSSAKQSWTTKPEPSCHCPHAHSIDGHASAYPYLLVMLFLGVAVRTLLEELHAFKLPQPPFTVVMGCLGLALSAIKSNTSLDCHELGKSITAWENVHPGE